RRRCRLRPRPQRGARRARPSPGHAQPGPRARMAGRDRTGPARAAPRLAGGREPAIGVRLALGSPAAPGRLGVTLELRQVDAPPLRGIDLELAAGLHVVLGADADGSRELVEIVSGVRRPQRGTVRVLGRDPFRTPAVRRRIASLLAEEQLPHAATVEQLVGHALALHAQPASDALRALSDVGIEAWRARRPSSLDAHERRTVALAIALAQAPALLVAHEPLARVAAVERGRVIERLNALAAKDTCVLCTTSSPRDALELADAVWLLEAGRLTRRPSPARRELVPGHA